MRVKQILSSRIYVIVSGKNKTIEYVMSSFIQHLKLFSSLSYRLFPNYVTSWWRSFNAVYGRFLRAALPDAANASRPHQSWGNGSQGNHSDNASDDSLPIRSRFAHDSLMICSKDDIIKGGEHIKGSVFGSAVSLIETLELYSCPQKTVP